MLRQQLATVGCVYTTAFRRFSSSMTGDSDSSPSHLSPKLVMIPTPSAFKWSKAYSISFKLSSTLGNGSEANRPNRPGKSVFNRAPYSLHARASCLVSLGIVEPNARGRKGAQGQSYARSIHVFNRPRRRPIQHRP